MVAGHEAKHKALAAEGAAQTRTANGEAIELKEELKERIAELEEELETANVRSKRVHGLKGPPLSTAPSISSSPSKDSAKQLKESAEARKAIKEKNDALPMQCPSDTLLASVGLGTALRY
jgi:hypothetical protein